jgi:hypothetical protein
MEEYGRLEQKDPAGLRNPHAKVNAESHNDMDNKTAAATLMQAEERNTGAVTWNVYQKYLAYAGGVAWAPVIIGLLLLDEAARGEWYLASSLLYLCFTVANNLFLGFWTSRSIEGFSQGEYMAVYAGLGAVVTYVSTFQSPHHSAQGLWTPCWHSF